MTYENDNIFAKILRGEMACHKIYEDDKTFAFMDIMPRADGHSLILPKNPSRNLLDVAADDLAAVLNTTQRIAKASMTAFDAQGITVQQFNEIAGGQIVFHLHFHVLPRHEDVALRPPGVTADNDILEAHANKLRAALTA